MINIFNAHLNDLIRAPESGRGLIISMAKSLLDYGKADTLEEVYSKINAVTSDQLLEIANEIFDPAKLTTLIFNAKE